MSIKTVLDSLDGVDEALKPLYVEHDGKFHLDLDESVRDHRDVVALRNAHERNKTDLATARTEAKKAKDDLAAALKDKPDEAALIAERQRLEAERDEWKGKAETAEGKLTGVTRDQAFKTALSEAGITDPFYVDLLTAKHSADVKMIDGRAMVDAGMGPIEVAAWAKRQAAGPWQKAVTPAQGGGAKGNQNGTTTTKKPEELTAQERGDLLRSNPDEFYRLYPHAKRQ